MERPKTLLQLAGASTAPSAWESAALVLVDVQREYTEGRLPLAGADAAVTEACRLLDLARAKSAPVFHIVHRGRKGGYFDLEGPFGAIVAALTPRRDETVMPKALPNAFAGTELDAMLKHAGRSEIVVAGFATHMCISSTVRSALDHGYRTTVVAGACATRDLPDPLGGVIAAEALHRAALTELADRFAVVVPGVAAWPGG